MGGMAVAATLLRAGFAVQIYEQASRFARVGAGIQMMPNSMKVLRGIGVEDGLRKVAFAPYSHLNREWDTGTVLRELPMPEALYGAPYLCMHRGDLHDALAFAVPQELVHLSKKLKGIDQTVSGATMKMKRGMPQKPLVQAVLQPHLKYRRAAPTNGFRACLLDVLTLSQSAPSRFVNHPR